MANKRILEKLRKLLALGESARVVGSVHEAEAAALRFNELLVRYGLSLSDVELHELENEEIRSELVYRESRAIEDWMLDLGAGIGVACGCVFGTAEIQGLIMFSGRSVDRGLAIRFFRYFSGVIEDLGARFEKAESARDAQGLGTINYTSTGATFSGYMTFSVPQASLSEKVSSYKVGIARVLADRLREQSKVVDGAVKPAEGAEGDGPAFNPAALVFLNNRYNEVVDHLRGAGMEFAEPKFISPDGESMMKGMRDGAELALTDRVLEGGE